MGFSEKEAKVYLTCIKSGACTVANIAEAAGVKRPTTYVMLKGLMEKELVQLVKKGKKTYFAAMHPHALKKHVERERAALSKKEAILAELLPILVPMASETITE
jgi:sugar-specific transcriptional regulator TrmB